MTPELVFVESEAVEMIWKTIWCTGEPQTVTKIKSTEIWWDKNIKTQKKIPHNRPDLVVRNNDSKQSKITDVSVPLDTNVKLREQTKRDNYTGVIDHLQRVYPMYKYSVTSVIIGALGTIPKSMETSLIEIGIKKKGIRTLIERMQKLALLGTVKVVKNCQKL